MTTSTDLQAKSSDTLPEGTIQVHVRRTSSTTEPRIHLFEVQVFRQGKGTWDEAFGSVSELRSYLRGLVTALSLSGYPASIMDWTISEHWGEPSQKRWTLYSNGRFEDESLDVNGRVIDI